MRLDESHSPIYSGAFPEESSHNSYINQNKQGIQINDEKYKSQLQIDDLWLLY